MRLEKRSDFDPVFTTEARDWLEGMINRFREAIEEDAIRDAKRLKTSIIDRSIIHSAAITVVESAPTYMDD